MSIVRTLIGNVKGPKGDTGETGATGPRGQAATVQVGTTTTAAYGTPASVTNSGTDEAPILDFVIPQGRPGEGVTDASGLTLNEITASSASYPTFTTGETLRAIFGKIQKFLSDLKDNYVSKSMMTTSTNVETAGQYVADAAVIKTLNNNSVSKSMMTTSTDVETAGQYVADAAVIKTLNDNSVSKSMMTTSTNVETAGQYVADAAVIKTLNDNSKVVTVSGTVTSTMTASNAYRIRDSDITSDMRVVNAVIETRAAMASGWDWETGDGYVDLTGSVTSGATSNITLELLRGRTS